MGRIVSRELSPPDDTAVGGCWREGVGRRRKRQMVDDSDDDSEDDGGERKAGFARDPGILG